MTEHKNPILVTGSSGKMGKWVINELKNRYTVIGLDVIAPPAAPSDWFFIPMDVTSDKSVTTALKAVKEHFGHTITSFIHLAGYFNLRGEHPELYEKITVQGTKRVLEGIHPFQTEQFLFSSTELIYSPCKLGQKINESSPVKPSWDHPRAKLKAEKLIHQLHGNVATVILDIAACYDNECHAIALAHQIQRIYEKRWTAHFSLEINGMGSPISILQT